MMKATKLLFVVMAMALMSAVLLMHRSGFSLIVRTRTRAESRPLPAAERSVDALWTTAGPSGTDLKGKMITMSLNGGGIRLYKPHFSDPTRNPYSTTRPYRTTTGSYSTTRPYRTTTGSYSTTRPYRTTTGSYSTTRPYRTTTGPYSTTRPAATEIPATRSWTTHPWTTRPRTTRPRTTRPPTTRPRTTRSWTTHSWTTAPPFAGVSVCLRYLANLQGDQIPLFTLSPSRNPLTLKFSYPNTYILPFDSFYYAAMYLTPFIPFWKNIDREFWTRVCLVIDNTKNVAQVFSGSNMSVRSIMPDRYVWSGEPVIDIPGFDGQVTDVQVWDYPLRYKEVFNYMTNGVYASYRGSVITWSSIGYSLRGSTLLEDVYEKQANQPISSRGQGRGRRPKGERRTKGFVGKGERRERNNQWFK